MNLFDEKKETSDLAATHNENIYNYYDRSARPDILKMKKIFNQWFDNYPPLEKNELKNRFKTNFSAAFYELFLYNLFKLQGFNVEIHPPLPSSTKRPDFLISKDGLEIYIEAKLATGESKLEDSQKKRLNEIYDSLDKITSPNFLIGVEEIVLKSKVQPTTKDIRNRIEAELTKYDPAIVSEDIRKYGFEASPKVHFENSGLKLVIFLKPKIEQFKYDRIIEAYPVEVHLGGEEDSIKKGFEKKANRYGKLNKPFIVCINSIGPKFFGNYDVNNAVWGTVALAWSNDPDAGVEKPAYMRNGLFLSESGPVNQNASGVLINNIMELNIPESKYWFIKHPFANNDLNFDIFEMTYHYIKKGKIETKYGKTIGQLLKIGPNWLN